jgi:hypothetical protein
MGCETCGREKKMYYVPWCPVCEKPQVAHKPVLNLMKALYHLEAIGYDGIKARLWSYISDDHRFANDIIYLFYFPEEDVESEQLKLDLEVFQKTFDLKSTILLEVSW